VVLLMSYSGFSKELKLILEKIRAKNILTIGMTGNVSSDLALLTHLPLIVQIEREACPLNLAPTASSTAMLAMGDAVAMSVSAAKGFSDKDFAEVHPAGSLGFKLLVKAKDLMAPINQHIVVGPSSTLSQLILSLSHSETKGICLVVDEKGLLLGVITDGDIRRTIEKTSQISAILAQEIMNRTPKTILEELGAPEALELFSNTKVNSLVVMNSKGFPIGILHIQDLLKAKAR
jgi:arabinose-5-phosphate isomerase